MYSEIRKIIHVDMDAFFASVEQRDSPELQGKPIVVGADHPRGVVAAASYEARKFGVRSAMPSVKAKKLCPHLIFVNGRMEAYEQVSAQIHEIFQRYTDLIEPLSLDEAFLDVTENKKGYNLAVDIAKEIKAAIKDELHLVASAGVSYNKFLAKIASDYRKPNGLCTIHPSQAFSFIENLPIESFWGVGPVTAKKMHKSGIHRGEDLKQWSLVGLTQHFGKMGQMYYDFARGVDHRPVEAIRIRKSLGCENTLSKDISTQSAVIIELYHVATELVSRVKADHFRGVTLTLKIKFNDFTQVTRSITIDEVFDDLDIILPQAKKLLSDVEYATHPIRLIGLSVSNPILEDNLAKKTDYIQLKLKFTEKDY